MLYVFLPLDIIVIGEGISLLCILLKFFKTIFFLLGLVDAHTHPVWAGDRVHEFAMKVNLSGL